jgi:hypothetical protein
MEKLIVGQELLFIGNSYSNHKKVRGKVKVTSVGRKWAEIKGVYTGRISLDSLHADGKGFNSPGICYRVEGRLAGSRGRQPRMERAASHDVRHQADHPVVRAGPRGSPAARGRARAARPSLRLMAPYLRELPAGVRFMLCRNGRRYRLLRRQQVKGRLAHVVLREDTLQETTLHHSCRVKPILRA